MRTGTWSCIRRHERHINMFRCTRVPVIVEQGKLAVDTTVRGFAESEEGLGKTVDFCPPRGR